MRTDPFEVVRMFELALARYAGSLFAVATTSCTTALLIALANWKHMHGPVTVSIPKHTYIGVAQSVLNAGHRIEFHDEDWTGSYLLRGTNIEDSARLFTSGMYTPGRMVCCSFQWTKHLAIGQGGCILHDDPYSDEWMRRYRFDGRREFAPINDPGTTRGVHAYMMPRDAAEGLSRLAALPDDNEPLPNSQYPDLSKLEVFQ